MKHPIARIAAFAVTMTAASGSFAAAVIPLGSPMDDALVRGSLLALAAAVLVAGVAIVRRKQGR
jgi:hypothetical protein